MRDVFRSQGKLLQMLRTYPNHKMFLIVSDLMSKLLNFYLIEYNNNVRRFMLCTEDIKTNRITTFLCLNLLVHLI